MRIQSWLSYLLANYTAFTNAAASDSLGLVEVDLVFPRNETYKPTSAFPIIFGIRNPDGFRLLGGHISVTIYTPRNMSTGTSRFFDLRWKDFSNHDPYFTYATLTSFDTEDYWKILWSVGWTNCTGEPYPNMSDGSDFRHNTSTSGIYFTTSKDASREVDLVAATQTEDCNEDMGFAFNLTKTYKFPSQVEWYGLESCAAVAPEVPAPSPCQVKIDAVAAASISASMTERLCQATNPVVDCGTKKSDAQRLLVLSVTCIMVMVGAVSFFVI